MVNNEVIVGRVVFETAGNGGVGVGGAANKTQEKTASALQGLNQNFGKFFSGLSSGLLGAVGGAVGATVGVGGALAFQQAAQLDKQRKIKEELEKSYELTEGLNLNTEEGLRILEQESQRRAILLQDLEKSEISTGIIRTSTELYNKALEPVKDTWDNIVSAMEKALDTQSRLSVSTTRTLSSANNILSTVGFGATTQISADQATAAQLSAAKFGLIEFSNVR